MRKHDQSSAAAEGAGGRPERPPSVLQTPAHGLSLCFYPRATQAAGTSP